MVPDKLKKINKLISSKEYKEALYYIESLLQTEPNSFFNHYLKGLVLHKMKQFEDAVKSVSYTHLTLPTISSV